MKKSNLYGLIALVLTFVMIFSVMVSANAAGTLTTQEIDQILNTTTDTAKTSNAVTEAVAKVYDSVVLVRNYTVTRSSNYGYGWGWGWGYDNDYGNNQGAERLAGFGSGTVVTEYGHVLTNYHVIEGASRVTVYDGENEYAAEVVAYDQDKDVAVLLAPELNLPAVELGDSDALQVGETAIVIGNPMSENFFRTTPVGVISSMDRSAARWMPWPAGAVTRSSGPSRFLEQTSPAWWPWTSEPPPGASPTCCCVMEPATSMPSTWATASWIGSCARTTASPSWSAPTPAI